MAMYGTNEVTIAATSLEECMAYCDKETSITCISLDYTSSGSCHLSSHSHETVSHMFGPDESSTYAYVADDSLCADKSEDSEDSEDSSSNEGSYEDSDSYDENDNQGSTVFAYDRIFYCMPSITVQITFIFIDFRVCDFAFAFKTQNAPCVSRFKRVLFSDRFQFAF